MTTTEQVSRWTRRAFRVARSIVLALVTPLMEKNGPKTFHIRAYRVPVVFSMARLIVLAFATAMLHQAWHAGIAGWPEATLSIAIVIALPLLNALERIRPMDVVALMRSLFTRFGQGATRQVDNIYATEPNKRDDHREDGGPEAP